MKLRIQRNSIRLRLSQSEVARLANGERIEETTNFSTESKLTLSIVPARHSHPILATFENSRLEVTLSSDDIGRWANSEQVGIEAEQPLVQGQSLKILVEKDFECLHQQNDPQLDAFPNPQR